MLFDSRYRTNEDRATCFEVCDTFKEAKKNARDYGNDTVIVEADDDNGKIENCKIIN